MTFTSKNKKHGKYFINELIRFTDGKCNLEIVSRTCKVHLLFPLKNKVQHLNFVIYKVVCSCGERHNSGTIRNLSKSWNEHSDTNLF